jgi:hypothetical protein
VEGLTPALKAARTAFSLPLVSDPALGSAAALRGLERASGVGFVESPRRLTSAVTAASNDSTSASGSRWSAPARSLGKTGGRGFAAASLGVTAAAYDDASRRFLRPRHQGNVIDEVDVQEELLLP